MRAIAAPQLRAVGLICAVHFFSHFYLLILPALLPVLAGAYNVGYTELGFALSAYSIATGLLQAPIGFVVDRHGARHLLIAAMFIIAIAPNTLCISGSAVICIMPVNALTVACFLVLELGPTSTSTSNVAFVKSFSMMTSPISLMAGCIKVTLSTVSVTSMIFILRSSST